MILVDTSVLISYLNGKGTEKTEKYDYALMRGIPCGITQMIMMETLQGVRDDDAFERLKTYLLTQKIYEVMHGGKSYADAANLYRKCRKNGITVRSSIGTLIAQTCIEHNLLLLHDDADFSKMSKIIIELKEY